MLQTTLTAPNLLLKKRLIMRGYQETIVSDILGNYNMGIPYVLGACPGSGKTEIAIEVIIRLIESRQVDRVLILAHSTNVLKENFYNRLMTYFEEGDTVDIMRGQSDYNYDAIIQVMIPQNINHIIETGQRYLLVTDEAHHNVLAEGGNYSKIVELIKPQFELLLTGTPSKFILQNNIAERDLLPMPYYINAVGMDVVGSEFFHKVRFDLIKSAYGFDKSDYNSAYNIAEETKFSYEDTERTVNNLIVGVVRNVALRNDVVLPSCADFALEGRKLIQSGGFGKTLIMCRNIEQADQVSRIISDLFKIKVHVSQSQNDSSSDNLTRFKNNEFQFLCVVNRAREGYDDAKVVNLIDITMTHNIDLIYQMFCRVVRLDKNNPRPKLYIKVTPNADGMPKYTRDITTASLMLGSTINLTMFNGNNFRAFIIPKIEWDDSYMDQSMLNGSTDTWGESSMSQSMVNGSTDTWGESSMSQSMVNGFIDIVDGDKKTAKRRKVNDMMALDLVNLFVNDQENLISGNERYAMTTLGESLSIITGDVLVDKVSYHKLMVENSITGGDIWSQMYKELSERDGINYKSNPWFLFNQTQKEFYDECYPERLESYSSKEGYFKLFRDNGIITEVIWKEKYKEISKRDDIKYLANPWRLFKQKAKCFLKECYPDSLEHYSNKEGYFRLLRDNVIPTGGIWKQRYKEISKRDGIRYLANPWKLFNQTFKEFFDECYPERQEFYTDKEGYFRVFRENRITSGGIWGKKYKEISKKDGIRYHVSPWNIFNQNSKCFIKECYPERQEYYRDKEGYFILFRENGIKTHNIWKDAYKALSERDGLRYSSAPWKLFNQYQKDFLDECYPKRIIDKEGYFSVFKKYNITTSKLWYKKYKELSETDGVDYKSNPHTVFKQTVKDFYDEYRQHRF